MLPTVTMPTLGGKRYSFVSTTSSYQSDDIAITPCHTPSPQSSTPASSIKEPSRSPSPAPSTKHFYQPHFHHDDVASHAEEYSPFKELMYAPPPGRKSGQPDAETLWNRMLLVQMCCGLYNSARLNAAIETGDFERFMPPKSTLDMMNDCVAMRPEDVLRLKVGIEIKENKLRKYMPPAWKLH